MSILFPQLSTFFRPQATRMLISYSTSNPILFQSVRPVRPHKNFIIIYCNIHHHHHLSVDSLLYCIFVSIYHLYTFLLQKKSHLNNLLSKRKLLSNLQICFDNNFFLYHSSFHSIKLNYTSILPSTSIISVWLKIFSGLFIWQECL